MTTEELIAAAVLDDERTFWDAVILASLQKPHTKESIKATADYFLKIRRELFGEGRTEAR